MELIICEFVHTNLFIWDQISTINLRLALSLSPPPLLVPSVYCGRNVSRKPKCHWQAFGPRHKLKRPPQQSISDSPAVIAFLHSTQGCGDIIHTTPTKPPDFCNKLQVPSVVCKFEGLCYFNASWPLRALLRNIHILCGRN